MPTGDNTADIKSNTTSGDASLLLSNSSSTEELLVDYRVEVDHEIPVILDVTSNYSSNEKDLATGHFILITIKFSKLVTIRGYIRLLLSGESKYCSARYHSGDNTNLLNFIYLANPDSGTSRLDCAGVDALDVSAGSIYRHA